jgi:hypothetical protein
MSGGCDFSAVSITIELIILVPHDCSPVFSIPLPEDKPKTNPKKAYINTILSLGC